MTDTKELAARLRKRALSVADRNKDAGRTGKEWAVEREIEWQAATALERTSAIADENRETSLQWKARAERAESALAAERERREKAEREQEQAFENAFNSALRAGRQERRADKAERALEEIDAVSVDFGHFEAAARTMKEIVRDFRSRSPDSGGEAEPVHVAECMDCGLEYGDIRFQDLVVPDDAWRQIAPDDGLLCPSCLSGRGTAHGIKCQAEFHSGAFSVHATPPPITPAVTGEMTASQAVQHCLDVLDHMRTFGAWDKEALTRASEMIGMLKRDLDAAALARKEAGE